jgi:hypothetical protein
LNRQLFDISAEQQVYPAIKSISTRSMIAPSALERGDKIDNRTT